ncbi:MAG: DUF2961 domain-containing protein [Armatimonadetes bacterium]|nr:DUF2961 domain-containing protein [Armatimonadota bacterium]
MLGRSTLSSLPRLRSYRSMRASSYETTGGNRDWWVVPSGVETTVMESARPGCIKHIWMTVGEDDEYCRKAVIRMYWDDQSHPAVEVPLGDFFGIGHGIFKNFVSAPLQMSPEDGRGMNCWWAMPFDKARVTIEYQGEKPKIHLYFYIDYEEYAQPQEPEVARFCAFWNRENPTEGWLKENLNPENYLRIWDEHPNLSDRDNYLILEAVGSGIFVGCHLNIDCRVRLGNDWYGEGDDMFVIDGEPWPPRLHGTGTEDYFNTAFGPAQEYCAPYHGIHLYSGDPEWRWRGKNSMYRYHIEDPIRFEKSIRVSIEHGEANALSHDFSSTAYWYQILPSRPLPPLLAVQDRMPLPDVERE